MEKKSLTRAKSDIIKVLKEDKEIPNIDKLELIMNLWLFLNEIKYEDNKKVLNKELRYDNNNSRKR